MRSRIIEAAADMGRRQPAFALGAVLLVAALLAVPMAGSGSSAPYAAARLECRRTASAGGPLTVVGQRFPAGAAVEVRFARTALARTTARQSGGFTVRTRVPADARSGPQTVTAAAATAGGSTASCVVTVRR